MYGYDLELGKHISRTTVRSTVERQLAVDS